MTTSKVPMSPVPGCAFELESSMGEVVGYDAGGTVLFRYQKIYPPELIKLFAKLDELAGRATTS